METVELIMEHTLSDEIRWQAVATRDAEYDGQFVYAVQSTGIYCRPSCPSRKPKQAGVTYYSLPAAAEQGGFRACKRCRPTDTAMIDPQVAMIQQVCTHIADNRQETLTLEHLGQTFHTSPYHLQRTFKALMGISPREYADRCRMEQFKSELRNGESVTDALYEAGYGSSSRLYERSSAHLGMTPSTYQKGGAGITIHYAVTACDLGLLMVAATERGVCWVSLGDDESALIETLRQEYFAAHIEADNEALQQAVETILAYLKGWQPHIDLSIDIRMTAFQQRVWQELRRIPMGETRSYKEIAEAIGQPTAARAVARACATNPVALVIPCHRVVRGDGNMGGYRWGVERKQTLLEQERSKE